ncbi:4064_t:CDS:2 [Funneliformis mosseae]|uniref:4064_t:CDS:1 n=1 Tax=Funneliformis mosseae TaxID=27381 RepID=A0A9N9BPK2_FUNMO|nr:4064_t:CDS:2 [Funneliformis mosseae]
MADHSVSSTSPLLMMRNVIACRLASVVIGTRVNVHRHSSMLSNREICTV